MSKRRYIVAGGLIDGSGAPVRRKVFLTVEDGGIAAIKSLADLPQDGVARDDLSHCVIVPALMDCSVSLGRSPSIVAEEVDAPQQAAMLTRHISYCHSHGVLAVADSSDLGGLVAAGEESAIAILENGRDFLRISSSPDIDDQEASATLLSGEELSRILPERGAKKAVVVANGEKEVAAALAAGCDAIEQGYDMGEENLRTMAATGVLWIPSVLRAKNGLDSSASGGSVCCRFSQRYVAPGQALPGAESFWKKMLGQQIAHLRLARELGVQTALGTGAGSTGILHGEAMVEEIKLFMTAGYSLEEAICCASQIPARFFGLERLGALSIGRPATFLVTRGSVKQLPRKLSYLEGIYIAGVPSAGYQKNPLKPAP